MANLTDIKNRIKNVSDTRQITNAMETISVAKMRKAMAIYENCKVFFEKTLLTINDIVAKTGELEDAGIFFGDTVSNDKHVHIVIASDKGLAGGYNANIFKHVMGQLKDKKDFYIFTVGQTAREFFENQGFMVHVEFVEAAFNPLKSDAYNIADTILNLYRQGEAKEVYISYTKLINSTVMYPETIRLLPLNRTNAINTLKDLGKDEKDIFSSVMFEPSAQEVLEGLIPQYLVWTIYGALIQSSAAEHSARRYAMSNATNNADDILDELKLAYNKARQENITRELTEIITGSMSITQEDK